METSPVAIIVEIALNFELLLQICLKLLVNVVHDRLNLKNYNCKKYAEILLSHNNTQYCAHIGTSCWNLRRWVFLVDCNFESLDQTFEISGRVSNEFNKIKTEIL